MKASIPQREHPATLITQLSHAEKLSDVRRICKALALYLGFSFFLLGIRAPLPFDDPVSIVLQSDDDESCVEAERQKAVAVKWLLEHRPQIVVPSVWDVCSPLSELDTASQAPMELPLDHGITIPFSGPINNLGIFILAREKPIPRDPHDRHALIGLAMFYATHIQQSVLRIALQGTDISTRAYRLTTRERQCLRLSMEGETNRGISEVLKISVRTVGFHIDNSLKKLGTRTRKAAVARALLLGELDISLSPQELGRGLHQRPDG